MTHRFSSTADLNIHNLTDRQIISSWFQVAFDHRMGAALWKLPGKDNRNLIIDTRSNIPKGKIELEETESGFLVAPFDNTDRAQELLLRADVLFNTKGREIKFSSRLSNQQVDLFEAQLKLSLQADIVQAPTHRHQNGVDSTAQNLFISTVEHALDAIKNGTVQKVVPAISREIPLEKEFSCLQTFEKLCHSYPEAFVSLVTTPDLGTWIGASPEAIIEVDRSKIFTTVAVAGTQKNHGILSLQEVAWTQKEIEEQALVCRYIINCFKKIRLREFEEIGPKTVAAGNLLHLRTTYTVDMEETKFPLLGSVMLDLLHPTSAVCGMPKLASQQFINQHESFDRKLFSGYLGPVNIDDETHLFVNLRCMQILQNQAILYAGAGVTEDSVPVKEWNETQLKCDTLLDVLNS